MDKKKVVRKSPAAKSRSKRKYFYSSSKPVRRAKKKRGFLAEMFSPGAAQGAFKTTLSGAVGGAAAGLVEKFTPNLSVTGQSMAMMGLSFLTASVGRMPNVAAGMAGVAGYKLGQSIGSGLSEGMNLAQNRYANNIEALPVMLSENGTPIMLSEGLVNPLQSAYATEMGGYF